jgi:tight adherence protein B
MVGAPRRRPVADRLRDDLVQAGYQSVGPRSLLVVSVIGFLLVLLLVLATTSALPVAFCFAAMAGYAPVALVRGRARKRRANLRELWPDAVDNIASGVRAGLALPEALSQLARRGPEELRPAFHAFAEDYRTTGRFHDCLDRLKERLSDPVGDRLVESLRIAREVGGSDLGRLLRTLSSFLREDARTRAELETRQSWTVNAARLAVAAPWVVLAMLATRPESIAAYRSATGAMVLLGGALVSVVAYRLMVRLGRLPEDERVLR